MFQGRSHPYALFTYAEIRWLHHLPRDGFQTVLRAFSSRGTGNTVRTCEESGPPGSATALVPESWKYWYNAITLLTYHVGDCSCSKFDLIKSLNAKFFCSTFFVWPAIIQNIQKFARSKTSRYTVYHLGKAHAFMKHSPSKQFVLYTINTFICMHICYTNILAIVSSITCSC